MSTRMLAVGALALTTIVTLTMACQSGFSIGGVGSKKSSKARRDADDGERAASAGDGDDSGGKDDAGDAEDEDRAGDAEPVAGASGAPSIDWCKGRKTSEPVGGRTQAVRNGIDFEHSTIDALAWFGCSGRLSESDNAAVLAYYARLRKWSKLPAAELTAYLHALVDERDPIQKTCDRLDVGKQAHRGLGRLLACKREDQAIDGPDLFYIEDDTSSVLASLAVVHTCLGDGTRRLSGTKRAEDEASYALCGSEWRLIQREKATIDAELDELKVPPAARTRVRISYRQVEATAALTEEYLAPKVKDDPALKAFYYKIPDKAYLAAVRVAREGADDLEAVRAFEARFSKSSRPQVEGCYAELRQRLMGLLRKKKVKTYEKARYEMVGPIGYQISRALEACARKDGQENMALAIADFVDKADTFRGPRTMVYWFLRDALEKMEGDKPTTVENLDRLRPAVPNPLGRPVTPHANQGTAEGVVVKVSKKGGGVLVKFKTVVTRDEDRECWDTKKVHSFNQNGTPVYYKKCGPWKKVTERSTEAPAFVAAENAAGLAPGRKVTMYCDGSEKPRVCAPFVVTDKKGEKLAAFLGSEILSSTPRAQGVAF